MRHRKTDAHIATIRVSVPIAAMDAQSVSAAAEAIAGIASHLPPGSTVEVLNRRFGRVDVAPVVVTATGIITGTLSEIAESIDKTIAARDVGDIPDSLRRVPRPAPNGEAA